MEKLIVFLVVVIFSIIKSMIDKSAEKRAQQIRPPVAPRPVSPPPPGPPAGQRDRVQAEMEAFLSDVRAGNAGPRPDAGTSPAGRSTTPAVASASQSRPESRPRAAASSPTSDSASRRSSSGEKNRQGSRKAAAESGSVPRPPKKKGGGSAERKPSDMGSGIRKHVNQHIGQHVDQHMKRQIDDRVRADLSGGLPHQEDQDASATGQAVPGKSSTAGSLFETLRSPGGVRQAMLINEILSRPRVFRR